MKHIKFSILSLVTIFLALLSDTVYAQEYYYKKGWDYELHSDTNPNFRDYAFSEYKKGEAAGEIKCALRVVACYVNEFGTPRNISAAQKVLDKWANKDALMCFFASCYNMDEKLDLYYWERFFDTSNYDIYLSWMKFERFPADLTKALFYANKFHQMEHSERSQCWLNYVLMRCYEDGQGGLGQNLGKALSLSVTFPNGGFYPNRIGLKMLEKICTFDEFVAAVKIYKTTFDTGIWKSLDDLDAFTSLKEDLLQAFVKVFDEMYPQWLGKYDNIEMAYANAGDDEKFAIDFGLAIKCYAISYYKHVPKIDSYNSNPYRTSIHEVDLDDNSDTYYKTIFANLKSLYKICPSEESKNRIKIAYSRFKIREHFDNYYFYRWEDIKKIFELPLFVECSGASNYYTSEYELSTLIWATNHISTKKTDVAKNQQFRQKHHKYQSNNDIESYYYLVMNRSNVIENDFVKQVRCKLKNVEIINLEYPGTGFSDAEIKTISDKPLFLYELTKYNNENLQSYAKECLRINEAKRKEIESKVSVRNSFNIDKIKLHDQFRDYAFNNNIKKMNMQLAATVLGEVILPLCSLCDKAIALYPFEDNPSALKIMYEEERLVANIIIAVESEYSRTKNGWKKNENGKFWISDHEKQLDTEYSRIGIENLYNSYIKQYPSGSYRAIVDSEYAIWKATQLSRYPSQNDANKVLSICKSNETLKIVKGLIKEKNAK